ncbi:protein PFC0760c-like isoform X1 [Aphidius gifuensis]|uniref:protein PFC0760c-like isoform X1 n=1 Tax=Aphidius gifuensis TaxID=684658 RepID=UPI001CDD5340|nr:protein PFC0760c-like isoform X1 [Aphidius gifuensis]XP_044019011.1 protein PFC0760c-like isoform X1 [Aphidius gifuensis]
MMNSLPKDTVTSTKCYSTLIDVNDPKIIVSPRAESTPGARKRRMMEQPSSNTSKTPRKDPAITRVTNKVPDKIKYEKNNEIMQKPPMHPDLPRKRILELSKRDDSTRLRKTIQWLENGAKKLRDDLAEVRSELHEERHATRVLKKKIFDSVLNAHIDKSIIADIKIKLSDVMRNSSAQIPMNDRRADSSINKNHKREILEARKKIVEANEKMKNLKTHSIDSGGFSSLKRRKIDKPDFKRVDSEIQSLRQINKQDRNNFQMKKLQDSEKNLQIRLEPCIEKKFHRGENLQDEQFKKECEIERLRELAVEQQEVIEYLRQALKERERKLDQLSNKKRKEEFYKQWLELEPVAEVDDEDQYEEDDSALSSTPSSLSPQPCSQYQKNSLTRDSYENIIIELEELQTKYIEEKQELLHAKSQVKDLEKALLQETRGSQNNRRALNDKLKRAEERELSLLDELSDMREQNELLEFRILELEETGSRETPDTADSGIVSPELIYKIHQTNQNNKQQQQQQQQHHQQQQQRAIATVIPYNNNNDSDNYNINNSNNNNDIDDNNNHMEKLLFTSSKKSPLSLQESGIFDDDDVDDDDDYDGHIEFINCGTQTETPSCELLQEVERLQQLRERIQERAVKVPVQVDNTLEIIEDNNKILFYKEKIKELEERLEIYEVTDVERSRENKISKQRENDLLDENYRLTEKLHLLENKIHNYEKLDNNNNNNKENFIDKFFDTRDIGTCTDDNIKMDNCLNCQILKKDYYDIVQKFSQIEYLYRKKYMNLKNKEIAFANILKEIDNIWCQREVNYNTKLKKNQDVVVVDNIERMNLIKKIDEFEKISQFMDIDEIFEMKSFSKHAPPSLTDDVQNNISNNQVINVTNDLVSQVPCNNVDGVVQPQKINQMDNYNIENSIIKTSETKALEKVRKRWKCRSEREGWAMKVSKKFQDNNRNSRRSIDKHRLSLRIYTEICV